MTEFIINECYKMFVCNTTNKADFGTYIIKVIGKTKHYVTFEQKGIKFKKMIRKCALGEFVIYCTSKSKHTLLSYDVLIQSWNKTR